LFKEDGVLKLHTTDAATLHNTVRALAGWPGTTARFSLQPAEDAPGAQHPSSSEMLDVRIVRTHAVSQLDVEMYGSLRLSAPGVEVGWATDGTGDMLVPCGGGGVLRVTTVQPPTKKAMAARDFKNGLKQKRLLVDVVETAAAVLPGVPV
jgi:methionyl-tRNA formyltransferase